MNNTNNKIYNVSIFWLLLTYCTILIASPKQKFDNGGIWPLNKINLYNKDIEQISGLTIEQYYKNSAQMAPSIAISSYLYEIQSRVLDIVSSRQISIREEYKPKEFYIGKSKFGFNYWYKNFKSSARQRSIDLSNGYRTQASGTIVGIDTENDARINLGIAASLSKGSIYENMQHDTYSNIRNLQTFVYGSYRYWHSFFDWAISIANNSHQGFRTVNYDIAHLTSEASYRSRILSANANFGHKFNIFNETKIINLFQIKAYKANTSVINETGGGRQNLFISNKNNTAVKAETGIRLISPDINFDNNNILHEFKALIGYDLVKSYSAACASFRDQPHSFAYSAEHKRLGLMLGSSGKISWNNISLVDFNYAIELKKKYTNQQGGVSLKVTIPKF